MSEDSPLRRQVEELMVEAAATCHPYDVILAQRLIAKLGELMDFIDAQHVITGARIKDWGAEVSKNILLQAEVVRLRCELEEEHIQYMILKSDLEAAEAKRETARRTLRDTMVENERLRGIIAKSTLPCLYCGLPGDEMIKCALGFPGCGRADDLMSDPALDLEEHP